MEFLSNQYALAFVKFALLATFGEILAGSISRRKLFLPAKLPARMVIWGGLGIGIAFMMKVYYGAMLSMMKPNLDIWSDRFLLAFGTSCIMNLTFAPAFMLFHKHTDTYLDLSAGGGDNGLRSICDNIDYYSYIKKVLLTTIPLFWIPAHTVTFLLPEQLRVLFSAALSIVLGLILTLKPRGGRS